MNIKLITKAMHTLSLLSEDDVQMVLKLRGLSEDERQMLMLVLEPQKPQKKSSKKSAGGKGKSKHASSLQQQIQTARPGLDGGVSKMRCAMENCGEYADSNVHHLTTHPVYHEFIPPAEQAAVASGD